MMESLTIKEFLALLIRRSRGICITALVFALLVGGLQGLRLQGNSMVTDDVPLDEAEQFTLERTQKLAEDKVSALETYIENAPLMQIDPFQEYVTTVLIHVIPVAGSQTVAANDVVFSDVNVCAAWLGGSDMQQLAAGSSFAHVDNAYLQELVSSTPLSDHILSLTVIGASQEQSEELAAILYQGLKKQFDGKNTDQPVVGRILSSATQIRTALGYVVYQNSEAYSQRKDNLSTFEKQVYTYKNLSSAKAELSQAILNGKQAELALPHDAPDNSAIKSCVKYGVLGFVLGLVLACAWVLVQGVFSGRVETPAQLAAAGSAPYLGTLQMPKRASMRISAALSGETLWADTSTAAFYLTERIAALPNAKEGVLILSSASEPVGTLSALTSALQEKGCRTYVASNAVSDPGAFPLLKQSGIVLLAECRGCARAELLCAEQSLLAALSRKVDGVLFV